MVNKRKLCAALLLTLFLSVFSAPGYILAMGSLSDSGSDSSSDSGSSYDGGGSDSSGSIGGSFVFSSGGTSGAGYADAMDEFGKSAVGFIKCSMQGNIGGIIIGLGVIMALWEYFVQHRQMHVLYAMLVVIFTIFLGAAIPMPDGYSCDGGGSSDSGWSFSVSGLFGG